MESTSTATMPCSYHLTTKFNKSRVKILPNGNLAALELIDILVLWDEIEALWPTLAKENTFIRVRGLKELVQINASLHDPIRSQLIHFLISSMNVFTWVPNI